MPSLLYLGWRLEIVNQHTQFGYREISDTEHVRYTKTGKSFEPSHDLDLENNNLIFTQNIRAYNDVASNYIWLQKDQHFSRYGRNSHI